MACFNGHSKWLDTLFTICGISVGASVNHASLALECSCVFPDSGWSIFFGHPLTRTSFYKTNSSTPLEKARTRVPRDQVFSLLFVYCSLYLHKVIAFMTGLSTENCFARFLLSAHFLVREIVSSNCLPRFVIFVHHELLFLSAFHLTVPRSTPEWDSLILSHQTYSKIWQSPRKRKPSSFWAVSCQVWRLLSLLFRGNYFSLLL